MSPLKIQESNQEHFFLSFEWGIPLQGWGAKVVESRWGSRLFGVPMNGVYVAGRQDGGSLKQIQDKGRFFRDSPEFHVLKGVVLFLQSHLCPRPRPAQYHVQFWRGQYKNW
jgi:hypothetical protein